LGEGEDMARTDGTDLGDRMKNKYTADYSFFSRYNEKSCYWAGFIMADGCIRKNRNTLLLHLQSKDLCHLISFVVALRSNHPIYFNKHDNAYSFQIDSKQIVADLKRNFAIVPHKTITATFPKNLPKRFYNHFIRGVFDGDGSVTVTSMPTLSLVGNRRLITRINEIICSEVTIHLRANKTMATLCVPCRDTKWYVSLTYYGTNARKILKWLYSESEPGTRLYRKYDRYIQLFEEDTDGKTD
jgi:hypothetical protein